jgi:MFS family permease
MATVGGSVDPNSVTGRTWLLLGLLTLGVLIAFLDRTSLSSVMADKAFIAHFDLSDLNRGVVSSIFFYAYGIFHPVMGWVVDRYGVKWPYAMCFAIWSLATVLTGYVDSLVALVAMRFILGAGEAIAVPANYRWIRNNFDEARSGTAVGILVAGNKLGSAIGAPVAAWLIVNYNWQAMFVVTGIVGLIWLLPWLGLAKNDFPKNGAENLQRKQETASVPYMNILKSPVIWGALILAFAYGYFTFFCATWMPSYLVEQRGLTLQESGLVTFLSFVGVAVMAVWSGWMSDRLIAKGRDPVAVRKAFIVAGLVGGCTILIGANAETNEVALFWNIVSLSLLGLTTPNMAALTRITLIPKQAVGRVTGVEQVAASLAGVVSSTLSGWLLHISGSYLLPMMVIFVFLLIGAAATLILMHPKWSPQVAEG